MKAGDQMNVQRPSETGNQFEAQMLSLKVPQELVHEILEYHSKLTYAPSAMIFCQGAPADIIFWVVKGLVKESCRCLSGNRILVQLATAGDVIGCADEIDEKGNWIRRFEAQALSKCNVSGGAPPMPGIAIGSAPHRVAVAERRHNKRRGRRNRAAKFTLLVVRFGRLPQIQNEMC